MASGIGKRSRKSRVWPTTHWSLIGRTGAGGTEDRLEAITSVLEIYTPVLKRHVRARWHARADQVDDLVQEFVVSRIFQKQILQLADRDRGKFRSFLVAALDNFVSKSRRSDAAAKRGRNKITKLQDDRIIHDTNADPTKSFDYAWARQVLGQAIRRMRRECSRKDRPDVWDVFRSRILISSLKNIAPVKFATLADKLNLDSEARTNSLLVTANRMFLRNLRNALNLYAKDEADIDSEIRDLWRAVAHRGANFRR